MVYYKLHKFQPELVRKVKVLHKIKFPGRNSINMDKNKTLPSEVNKPTVLKDRILLLSKYFNERLSTVNKLFNERKVSTSSRIWTPSLLWRRRTREA